MFGKIRGGNFIYKLCSLWARSLLFLTAIRHKNLYESPHDPTQQYVFVFNHISYLDAPALLISFRKQHFRVLGKADMGKFPLIGFIYRNAAVLVQREIAMHRAKSVLILKSVLKKGISIVISPEGTFNITTYPLQKFYEGAFRIAIETQTPIKPVLFPDNFDRLNYKNIFSLCPGVMRAVFLEEIKTSGYTEMDINLLKEMVFKKMEEGLIRYKANWIESGIE